MTLNLRGNFRERSGQIPRVNFKVRGKQKPKVTARNVGNKGNKNTTNAEQWKGTYRKVWARRNVRKDRGPPTEKVRGNMDEQRSKGRVT